LTCVKAADPPSVPIQFWDVSDTDAATASYLPISRSAIIPADSRVYPIDFFIKKTTGKTTLCQFYINFTGGTPINYSVLINSTTGEVVDRAGAGSGTPTSITVQDYGDCWRVGFKAANNGTN